MAKYIKDKTGKLAGSIGYGAAAASSGNPLALAAAKSSGPETADQDSVEAQTEVRAMATSFGGSRVPHEGLSELADSDGSVLSVIQGTDHLGKVSANFFNADGRRHRLGGPARETFNRDGTLSSEEWYVDGGRHRLDGPAVEQWDSGALKRTKWYANNKQHRMDGPAWETFNRYGTLEQRGWLVNGEQRLDKPSRESFYPSGELESQEWEKWGLHRLDGPASESFYRDGTLRSSDWYADGELHRLGGPAREGFNLDGTLKTREWYVDGGRHRLEGPALETFNRDGTLSSSDWYADGVKIYFNDRLLAATNPTTPEEHLSRLARSANPDIAAFAAHNPSCPPAAKVMWVLTQPPTDEHEDE